MGRPDGMGMGLTPFVKDYAYKRKFRWIFDIPEISKEDGIFAIPPLRAARPSLTFKEASVQHLNEEIFFPMKTEWKPINLILCDTGRSKHPIVEWLSKIYVINDSNNHKWYASNPGGQESAIKAAGFKVTADLYLLDGCGNYMEYWVFEGAWPQAVDFGELDYGSNEIVTVNVTLRYDRAYWKKTDCTNNSENLNLPSDIPSYESIA